MQLEAKMLEIGKQDEVAITAFQQSRALAPLIFAIWFSSIFFIT